jgi:predicted lipoprotein with Yx(FWY)xxD motif
VSTNAASISTAKGAHGSYLVGPSGRALYLWVADTSGKSSCSGACAKVWPPLLAKSAPTASGGVAASDIGATTRSDGAKQVTYKGHPLYYFSADSGMGMTTGQGNDGFGAKWWLVAPSGTAITAGAASSGSSSGSSGGGYGAGAPSGY